MSLDDPYRPPGEEAGTRPVPQERRTDWLLMTMWPLFLAFNLVVSLYLLLSFTPHHGRLGILLGLLTILASGWCLCVLNPEAAWRVLIGAIVTGISQVVPILQFLLCTAALAISMSLGMASDSSTTGITEVTSEVGGYVMTLISATGVMAAAAGVGWMTSFFAPAKSDESPPPT